MLHFMQLTCYFLCSVFIMSQASATTARTTTPPVTVVYSSMSSLLSAITMAPSLMGLPVTSGHEVLPPPLTLRNSGGIVGLATVLQLQPQSQIPVQAYANYAMGPLQVGFSFVVESPTFFYMCLCLLWCMLSAFRCHSGCLTHLWGLKH